MGGSKGRGQKSKGSLKAVTKAQHGRQGGARMLREGIVRNTSCVRKRGAAASERAARRGPEQEEAGPIEQNERMVTVTTSGGVQKIGRGAGATSTDEVLEDGRRDDATVGGEARRAAAEAAEGMAEPNGGGRRGGQRGSGNEAREQATCPERTNQSWKSNRGPGG